MKMYLEGWPEHRPQETVLIRHPRVTLHGPGTSELQCRAPAQVSPLSWGVCLRLRAAEQGFRIALLNSSFESLARCCWASFGAVQQSSEFHVQSWMRHFGLGFKGANYSADLHSGPKRWNPQVSNAPSWHLLIIEPTVTFFQHHFQMPLKYARYKKTVQNAGGLF